MTKLSCPEEFQFYNEIESGVRRFVFLLRNAGINTECSCHHKGYIQCQTNDPTTEVREIKTVMIEEGIENFEIEITYNGLNYSTLNITSPAFVKGHTKEDLIWRAPTDDQKE